MARFHQIAKGTRAVHRVPLPLVNRPCLLLPDVPELAEARARDRAAYDAQAAQPGQATPVAPDQPIEVGLRALRGDETDEVLQKAHKWAVDRGAEPRLGNPVYDYGYQVALIFVACVDPDAEDPEAKEARFFESIEQILGSNHIGRDTIVYLAEAQEAWQDVCSPQALKYGTEQLEQIIERVAESDDPLVYGQLRPGARWSLLRTLAVLLRALQTHKSSSGSSSPTPTTSATSEPAP